MVIEKATSHTDYYCVIEKATSHTDYCGDRESHELIEKATSHTTVVIEKARVSCGDRESHEPHRLLYG